MLGHLAWEARRRAGRFSFMDAVFCRERMSPQEYVAYGLPVILWGALVFGLSASWISPARIAAWFSWLPDWFLRPAEFDTLLAIPAGRLFVFLGSLILFAGIVAPMVEELYFRGHLLPAVDRYGTWVPLWIRSALTADPPGLLRCPQHHPLLNFSTTSDESPCP